MAPLLSGAASHRSGPGRRPAFRDRPVRHRRCDAARDDGATSRLWWATKNEWLGLVDVAGLEVESLHGGFAGEPCTDDSQEYFFVTRRRA
jgi:hypothetical protein